MTYAMNPGLWRMICLKREKMVRAFADANDAARACEVELAKNGTTREFISSHIKIADDLLSELQLVVYECRAAITSYQPLEGGSEKKGGSDE